MSLWKHLRRRLLRNRGDAGWGPRAFLTLRIARTACPSSWQSDVTERDLSWCSDGARGLFGECSSWARTTYHADDATHYGVAFAIKQRYPYHVHRFAVAAARLTRALRAEGVRASWR